MTNTNWILTYTGKKFFPLEPNIEGIDIIDIAHALSNMCRFTGHTSEFYSVAEHSVHVAERIWKKTFSYNMALVGLLHDASKAYLIDVAKPVKESKEFKFYRDVEEKLQDIIYSKYGIKSFNYSELKEADNHLLAVEAFYLMPQHPDWALTSGIAPDTTSLISCWKPRTAKDKFLNCFLEFGGRQEKGEV